MIIARIRMYHGLLSFAWQKGHVRELELEPGKKYKMITLASKPPVFGKMHVFLLQLKMPHSLRGEKTKLCSMKTGPVFHYIIV